MKIIFSGGGTLGPVTPLLAMHEIIKDAYPDADFVWVGTKRGPEKMLVEKAGIPFITLSSGKFRRYISWWNIIDIARIVIGFFQSLVIIWKEAPDLCISAGGFISVPLHSAAWLLGIPTWIHQQDVKIGLANRLMAPCAKKITNALQINQKQFPLKKTEWLGNPVRREILEGDKNSACAFFQLDPHMPIVFATGGGTGSLRVNQLMIEALPELEGVCQIIHLCGTERPHELIAEAAKSFPYYHVYDFLTHEMKDAYAAADIVISRGGFGTLTEAAALGKPAIIIPKPGHQEENVAFLERKGAIISVDETTADGLHLAHTIKELLTSKVRRERLGSALHHLLPRAKGERVVEIVQELVGD